MPSIEIAPESAVSREHLRTFYLTGNGLDAFRVQGPLRPALLDEIELPRFERNYPLCIAETEVPQPLFRFLQNSPISRDSLDATAAAIAGQMGSRECASLASVLPSVLEAAHAEPAVRRAIPEDGWLIGFGNWTPALLSCALLDAARREARAAFLQELEEHAQRLQELLALDNRKSASASSAETVAASLGMRAESFLDSSALADALRRRTNSTHPMEAQRRLRCEQALATIQNAISELNRSPSVVLIHSGDAPQTPLYLRIECEPVADGDSACDAGLAVCTRQLNRYLPVWKALRVARLELASAYDASVHPAALEAFDWAMANSNVRAALPVVMVVATAREIEQSLASFVRLLQSGLPVQVLIACPDGMNENLGCIPLAYQEAFALSSSIAAPDHLVAGLSEMARTLRPAVAAVAVSESWEAAALLPLARVFPLYRYNPDLGETWRARLALNTEIPAQCERLTFAHAAALMPAFRDRFRVESADSPFAAGQAVNLPHLLVRGENGQPCNAIFTRDLENTGARAERRWQLLAELAAPQVVKEADPDAENRARLDGATQAIHGAISMLLNPQNAA